MDLWDLVADFLTSVDTTTEIDSFCASPAVPEGDKVLSELKDSAWWEEAQAEAAKQGSQVLCIILYTDGFSPYFQQHTTLVPVLMTLGNMSLRRQRSTSGKRLVGFIPHLTDAIVSPFFQKGSRKYDLAALRRHTVHSCLSR